MPEDRRFDGFNGYKKLLECGVDVVLLCTPPGFRPLHLRAAVEAGKHVFCEKPVAVDVPGIKSVIEAAPGLQAKHATKAGRRRTPFCRILKREGRLGCVLERDPQPLEEIDQEK